MFHFAGLCLTRCICVVNMRYISWRVKHVIVRLWNVYKVFVRSVQGWLTVVQFCSQSKRQGDQILDKTKQKLYLQTGKSL